jgi:penicillin-binding protein 2
VEQAFEAELRGTAGRRVVEVDADNSPVRTLEHEPPVAGNDIQLTVDVGAQAMAEVALAEQLDRIRGDRTRDKLFTITAPAGSVVVLDPATGGVVAMASYPTYDPAEFVNGISQDRYDQLTKGTESENPLVNRAIQGLYAPGSTFKPFTAMAAMQAGLIVAGDTKSDDGVYERPGDDRVFRNAGSKANGSVNVRSSLTVSSDWYYYWLGDRFWLESETYGDLAQQEGYERFGFGHPTGIELPGEAAGRVPTPEWRQQLWESYSEEDKAVSDPTWLPGDNMNMAIGQGYMLSSPLQLASAYATLANGGTTYRPQLLKAVLRPGGDPANPADVIRTLQPEVVSQVVLAPEMLQPIIEGLQGVVESANGTAYGTFQGFDLAAFPIAGKTGTAEVDKKAESSIFASFGPVGAPRYAVAAVMEESGFGADAAAPVVRRVYEVLAGQDLTAANDITIGAAGGE